MRVTPSEIFERDKLDLHTRAPISFIQAALGCSILVPTLHDPVRVEIPAGSQFGDTVRLEDEGIHRAKKTPGDLWVHLVVMTPTRLTSDQGARLAALAGELGLALEDAALLELPERGHDPIASLRRSGDARRPETPTRAEGAFEEMLRRAEESLRGGNPGDSTH